MEYSSRATDAELDERLMLNLFLLGTTRGEAVALADAPAGTLSRENQAIRDPAIAAAQRERRLGLIDRIWADPRPLVKAYEVSHIVLPKAATKGHLDGLAHAIAPAESWDLWKVD